MAQRSRPHRLHLPAALLAAALLAGCSPAYVLKSWAGHRRLQARRRPVVAVLADPAVPEALKEKLRLSEDVRRFADEVVGLPRSRSYADFVDVGRPHVTLAVSASRRTRFEAYEWWFPVVGRLPYKGFFDERDARAERARLERRGWDAWVSPVTAYSTLRWSADPLLSTMTDLPPAALAETLLHELTHGAVYLKGAADFNEAAATFVGEEASAQFLRERFGEDSAELRRAREDSLRSAEADRIAELFYAELDILYRSPLSEDEKLLRREAVFTRARAALRVGAINNAWLLARRRYRLDLEDFRRAHEKLGRDWPKTLALFRSLDRRRPREALREWLSR